MYKRQLQMEICKLEKEKAEVVAATHSYAEALSEAIRKGAPASKLRDLRESLELEAGIAAVHCRPAAEALAGVCKAAELAEEDRDKMKEARIMSDVVRIAISRLQAVEAATAAVAAPPTDEEAVESILEEAVGAAASDADAELTSDEDSYHTPAPHACMPAAEAGAAAGEEVAAAEEAAAAATVTMPPVAPPATRKKGKAAPREADSTMGGVSPRWTRSRGGGNPGQARHTADG